MKTLKQTDSMVLQELKKNSRTKVSDISEKLSLPKNTINRSLKKLKDCIIKFSSLIDPISLGFPIHAIFFIKPKNKEKVITKLKESLFINNLFLVSNSEIYVEAFFPNMAHMYNLIEALESKALILHVGEELKKENFSAVFN